MKLKKELRKEQPVRHGQWIRHGEPKERDAWYWTCSVCATIVFYNDYDTCPDCGAVMRKKGKHDNANRKS